MQYKSYDQNYEDALWLLNYSASHPISIIRYKASDVILRINDNALYLSVRHTSSWVGDHNYLSNNLDGPPNNGAINTIRKIIMDVIGTVAEAELGFTYINAQYSVLIRTCLINMGNPQPPNKLQIDNTTE